MCVQLAGGGAVHCMCAGCRRLMNKKNYSPELLLAQKFDTGCTTRYDRSIN